MLLFTLFLALQSFLAFTSCSCLTDEESVAWSSYTGKQKDLLIAILSSNLEKVSKFLDDPEVNPAIHNNLLFRFACRVGLNDVAREFLKCDKVNPAALEDKAVRLAAENGHLEVLKMLLADDRVNPGVNDNEILFNAKENCFGELLKHWKVNPGARNNQLIIDAVRDNLPDRLVLLLNNRRVYPGARDNEALIESIRVESYECFKHLYQDKRVNPRARNYEAIRLAAELGYLQKLRVLIGHHVVEREKATAVVMRETKDDKVWETIIKRIGTDIPLKVAIKESNGEMVRWILRQHPKYPVTVNDEILKLASSSSSILKIFKDHIRVLAKGNTNTPSATTGECHSLPFKTPMPKKPFSSVAMTPHSMILSDADFARSKPESTKESGSNTVRRPAGSAALPPITPRRMPPINSITSQSVPPPLPASPHSWTFSDAAKSGDKSVSTKESSVSVSKTHADTPLSMTSPRKSPLASFPPLVPPTWCGNAALLSITPRMSPITSIPSLSAPSPHLTASPHSWTVSDGAKSGGSSVSTKESSVADSKAPADREKASFPLATTIASVPAPTSSNSSAVDYIKEMQQLFARFMGTMKDLEPQRQLHHIHVLLTKVFRADIQRLRSIEQDNPEGDGSKKRKRGADEEKPAEEVKKRKLVDTEEEMDTDDVTEDDRP